MDINPIKVTYRHTNNAKEAKQWLEEYENTGLIACDFETAVGYSEEEREYLLAVSKDPKVDYLEQKKALSMYQATALDHPSHVDITHCSMATNDHEGTVFIFDNEDIARTVLSFLVETEAKQIWHNASFDFKHIWYHTGKMPKNYEDSAIFAKTLFNHVEPHKSSVGLKDLAGFRYGAWGISEDLFTKEQMYEDKMLLYAATDACATFWIFRRMAESTAGELETIPCTSDKDFSPWDQLSAAPNPKGAEYPESFFYHNTGKHLVRDTVRFSSNGLPIDLNNVRELELEVDNILNEIAQDIADNPYVKRYLSLKREHLLEKFIETQKNKCKTYKDFLVEFKPENAVHRSYYMAEFCKQVKVSQPEELLPTGVPKWSARLVKTLSTQYPALCSLVKKEVSPDSPRALAAMRALAEDKAKMHNANYLALIDKPNIPEQVFNPNSAKQKQEIFAMLGIESDAKSDKTGDDSWSREQIEIVNKTTEDDDVKAFTNTLIDQSFAAIINSNFVPAFYRYTVDGKLLGQYKLFGAKSMRFTSSNPINNWASRK